MCLQCATIRPNDALSSFNKPFLISDEVADFYDIARNAIVQNLHSLCHGDATSKKLDEITRFEDDIWVVSFSRRSD